MDKIYFIEHRDREILVIDFSSCDTDGVLAIIERAQQIIASRPHESLLTLTDLKDTQYNRRITEALKEYVAHNRPYVKAGAVIGLNDIKRVLFNALKRVTGRNLRAFEQSEAAKDWLVQY